MNHVKPHTHTMRVSALALIPFSPLLPLSPFASLWPGRLAGYSIPPHGTSSSTTSQHQQQMWFAAFQSYGQNPWLVNLVAKLLSKEGETRALVGSLLRHDPFWVSGAGAADSEGEGEGEGGGDVGGPPLFIKADLYLYE